MSRPDYPYTIENGAGESITFLRRLPGRNGERLEVESVVSPGAGPPMHIHHHQDEGFTVLEGRVGYQRLNQPAQFAGPGETVVFKAGEAHKFWNAGEGALRCSGFVEPPANLEYFLTELFASTRRNGGAGPNQFEAAFLIMRYRSEFSMLEIPAPVQRVVFPLLVALGRLLGKYRQYRDAPKPVSS